LATLAEPPARVAGAGGGGADVTDRGWQALVDRVVTIVVDTVAGLSSRYAAGRRADDVGAVWPADAHSCLAAEARLAIVAGAADREVFVGGAVAVVVEAIAVLRRRPDRADAHQPARLAGQQAERALAGLGGDAAAAGQRIAALTERGIGLVRDEVTIIVQTVSARRSCERGIFDCDTLAVGGPHREPQSRAAQQ
jgi:hypothetical protein